MTAKEIADLLLKGVKTAGDVSVVLQDPYLPESICLVQQVHAVENRKPVVACARTVPTGKGGVGLRKAVPALRAYVYAEQHPWVKPVAIAAVLGVPFLLGYLAGRHR